MQHMLTVAISQGSQNVQSDAEEAEKRTFIVADLSSWLALTVLCVSAAMRVCPAHAAGTDHWDAP